jgi:hypothetical protein
MKRKGIVYLLLLLLASAMLDDVWAASTAETDDDLLAAENNEYLASQSSEQQPGSVRSALPPFGVHEQAATAPGQDRPDRAAPPAPDARPFGPSLLYLLMSLQR